jgi:ankyrin repeat protein
MSAPASDSPSLLQRLLQACDEEDLSAVRQALECGANVNGKILYKLKFTQFGPTPSHPSTEKILEADFTPLYIACYRGHTEVAELLISHGALVEDSYLSVACNAAYADIVALLLSAGADVHFVNEDGNTPLGMSLGTIPRDAHLDIITMLHRAGAKINQLVNDGFGCLATPLVVSCAVGNMPMVSLLISLGADINNNISMGSAMTPLYAAASHGHADIVSLLLSAGADVDEGTPSPLIIACSEGQSAVVSILLHAGANTNKQCSSTGITPLHGACHKNHVDIALKLLLAGASMDIKDKQGRTPLDVAGNEKTRAAVYNMVKRCTLPSCHRQLLKGTRQKCSRCKDAYYCGKACSVQHWPVHRGVCARKEPK